MSRPNRSATLPRRLAKLARRYQYVYGTCADVEAACRPAERRKGPPHPGAVGAIPPDWKDRRA